MKKKILKTGRNILIAIVGITLFLALIGAGYIWWSGNNQTPVRTQPTPQDETVKSYDRPAIKPRSVGKNVPISTAVQSLTSVVKRGQNASVTIRSHPEVDCKIVVKYVDDSESYDAGLKPKKTDQFGIVSWAWTVLPDSPVGESKAEVICEKGKESSFVVGRYMVKDADQ